MALTTIQLLNYANWMPDVLGQLGSTWAKWLNPPAGVSCFPGVKLDVRIWTDDRDRRYIEAGEAGGRQFVRDMLPCWKQWPWATCYELANEPGCNGNDELRNLRLYTIGAMREASAQGIRLCILNLPEGNPSGPDDAVRWKWEQLVEAVKLAGELGHYVGMHLYWRPGVEGPLGRYHALGRRVWDAQQWASMGLDLARLQLLVTECGIDGGIADGPAGQGWRSLSNEQAYAAEIVELEREARRHPWLKSLMFFIAGHPGWQDFDMTESLCRGLVAPVRAIVDAPAIPPTVTAPGVTYRVPAQAPRMYSSPRAPLGVPLWFILHGTDGPANASIAWWASPNNPYRSSAHDLIDRQGVVWRCVPYDRAAHHAGGADARIPGVPAGSTNGTSNTNHVSVGIELECDPAPMGPGYTAVQLEAAVAHVRAVVEALGIPRERVLRHADVDPEHRTDPRGLDWQAFLDRLYGTVKPQPAGLPEHEMATDAPTLASKARWWLEEEQRAAQAGNEARANEIRLSLIKLLYRLENALKAV